ncbi:MAG TPA: hypothetical protein VFY93_16950 [Planctomycetota bacterium]|nr:hypothetical protein [Planctomycetota bacterium]
MSEQVRHLIGLENLLARARRRQRECERDEGADATRTRRFAEVVRRLGEEIHATDRTQLEDYLRYVEGDLIPRILHRVEGAKEGMVEAAKRVVAGKGHLTELRTEYSDALERSRSVRERLGLDPIVPAEARFGLGSHPPHSDRPTREAYDLVKEFLKG